MIKEYKQFIVDLPELISIAAVKMKTAFDIIQALDVEDEDCNNSDKEPMVQISKDTYDVIRKREEELTIAYDDLKVEYDRVMDAKVKAKYNIANRKRPKF